LGWNVSLRPAAFEPLLEDAGAVVGVVVAALAEYFR
jgi:hypothetical protein